MFAFPTALSDGGDLIGDGYADVVASGQVSDGQDRPGSAHISFGGPNRPTGEAGIAAADLSLYGAINVLPGEPDDDEGVPDVMGYSLTSRGDFNGDGYADLVIGAAANTNGAPWGGRVYIRFGEP